MTPFRFAGLATSASTYGGAGNDSMRFLSSADTLIYEGGLGADTSSLTNGSTARLSTVITLLQLLVAMIPSPLEVQHPVLGFMPMRVMILYALMSLPCLPKHW